MCMRAALNGVRSLDGYVDILQWTVVVGIECVMPLTPIKHLLSEYQRKNETLEERICQ